MLIASTSMQFLKVSMIVSLDARVTSDFYKFALWDYTQTYGALDKFWLGYVIAKNKDEHDKLMHYASIIQKLQRELDLEISSFPALYLHILDEEEDKYSRTRKQKICTMEDQNPNKILLKK